MRYLTFSLPGESTHRLGIVRDDQIIEVAGFTSLLALIQAGPEVWRRVANTIAGGASLKGLPHGDVRWHAPIPRPTKNVFCLGRNYAGHVKEAVQARGQEFKLPAHPIFFTKPPTSVVGPHDDIVWDRGVT